MIPAIDNLMVFVLATVAILIMPGPAVFYIVSRSVEQGSRAGLASTLGINVGTLFHIAAAALGASAILLSSATAFTVFKYAGAVALIWLGVRKLREKDVSPAKAPAARGGLRSAFLEGVVVNALNPKTAVFFYAFLPQFVNAQQGNVAGQVVFLGLLFVALGIVNDGIYAVAAGSLGKKLKGSQRLLRAQRRVTGGTLLVLGMLAAFAKPVQK
jgi:threonine/homoserine/homoserine lactone efflux protein